MMQIVFICLQLLFVIYLVYYIIAFLSGAPFVPTANVTADSMIRLAHLKKGVVAYDVGSGEGKLLKRIAQTGATAIGIEINPLLVWFCNIRFLFSPYRRSIHTYWRSFWTTDLSPADVIFVYLLPMKMKKLENKMRSECKSGTIVVSNSFMFPRMTCIQSDLKNHVFVYRV